MVGIPLPIPVAKAGFVDIVQQDANALDLAGAVVFIDAPDELLRGEVLPQHKYGVIHILGDHKGIGDQSQWWGVNDDKFKLLQCGPDKRAEPIGQ